MTSGTDSRRVHKKDTFGVPRERRGSTEDPRVIAADGTDQLDEELEIRLAEQSLRRTSRWIDAAEVWRKHGV